MVKCFKKMKYLYDWDISVDNLKIHLPYGYCCNKKILVCVQYNYQCYNYIPSFMLFGAKLIVSSTCANAGYPYVTSIPDN